MIRQYQKQEIITEATFPFTQRKLRYQLKYQGKISKKGKQLPDKRFDSSTEGLMYIFISVRNTSFLCGAEIRDVQQEEKSC